MADQLPARSVSAESLDPGLLAGFDERTQAMLQGRVEGRTFEELGRKHGVCKERARQLVAKAVERLRATNLEMPVEVG